MSDNLSLFCKQEVFTSQGHSSLRRMRTIDRGPLL
jgi:hypothetical protein